MRARGTGFEDGLSTSIKVAEVLRRATGKVQRDRQMINGGVGRGKRRHLAIASRLRPPGQALSRQRSR